MSRGSLDIQSTGQSVQMETTIRSLKDGITKGSDIVLKIGKKQTNTLWAWPEISNCYVNLYSAIDITAKIFKSTK